MYFVVWARFWSLEWDFAVRLAKFAGATFRSWRFKDPVKGLGLIVALLAVPFRASV